MIYMYLVMGCVLRLSFKSWSMAIKVFNLTEVQKLDVNFSSYDCRNRIETYSSKNFLSYNLLKSTDVMPISVPILGNRY